MVPRPSLANGSDQLIVTLYTLYISLYTLTANPNHFRSTHCIKAYLFMNYLLYLLGERHGGEPAEHGQRHREHHEGAERDPQ